MAFTARDGTTRTALSEINMVPFIDIVLVLLIIFMVTAPVIQSGVEIHVPKTQFTREITEERLVISITQNETIYLQNDPVNINQLVDKIKERKPGEKNISVYVRGDEDARWGALAKVFDKLKSAGIENISLVTEPLEKIRPDEWQEFEMKTAREKFERWILASVALHVSIVLLVFVAPTLFVAHPVSWGSPNGGTGGVNVKIVSASPGISLPAPPPTAVDAPNTESKSLYKSEPAPKSVAPLPDANAVKLPSKDSSTKPEPKPAATKNTDKPATAPSNAVAYGADGGSPSLRYGQSGQGGPIGAEFGSGTFGTQFGPYVESMKRIIADAWTSRGAQQPSPRVYVTFRIKRDGTVFESQLEKPSDNPTLMERAALQAIRRAKLQPLPSEYRGSDVAVRFYFDYVQ